MSEAILTIEEIVTKPLPGEIAWAAMALGILGYDLFAIKFKKCETMSSAVWRMLGKPRTALPASLAWLILTHHLFANKKARTSYKVYMSRKTRSN